MTVERGSNSYLHDRGLDRVPVGSGLAITLLRRYATLMVKGDQIPMRSMIYMASWSNSCEVREAYRRGAQESSQRPQGREGTGQADQVPAGLTAYNGSP